VTAITFSRNSALDRFMKADEVMNERRAIVPTPRLFAAVHSVAHGPSQPWQLPRRTAGHGSKADAGAQPLAGCQSASRRIAELEQEIDRLQRTEEAMAAQTWSPSNEAPRPVTRAR
jgi:hypothetical protein